MLVYETMARATNEKKLVGIIQYEDSGEERNKIGWSW